MEQKWFDIVEPFKNNGYNIQITSKPNLTPNRDKHFGDKISKIKIDNNHCGKLIKQYDLKGGFIKVWKSAAEVERVLGFKAENISACTLKKVKTSNGFIWRFFNDEIKIKDIEQVLKREKPVIRKIIQKDLDDNIIKIWSSLKQLNKESDFDKRGVKDTCNGKRIFYKNYKWYWES